MAIINLCKATDEGAVGHHYRAGTTVYIGGESLDAEGPCAYWTRLSHQGLCLKDRERNGYDDSDFFMTVWNPEKQAPEEIMFATTRGWSYPCYGSAVDATPDVKAAYEAWLKRRDRQNKAERKWAQRRELMKVARAIGPADVCTYHDVRRLFKATPPGRWEGVVDLLTSKLRSAFRISFRNQLIAWTLQPHPEHPSPLSRKQWDYVVSKEQRYRRFAYI
jgi:hypothetical protein